MTYYNDPGEKDWEEWMERCETIWREQGIGAYKACGCDTKTKSTVQYETKSLGTGIVPRAPETKTLSGSSASRGTYETKSSWGSKEAVITENDIADALKSLRGIRTQCRCKQQETFVEKQLKASQCVTEAHQDRFQRELALARQEQRKIYW